jgi:hypothetical protein
MEQGYDDKDINKALGWDPSGRNLRKIKRVGKLDGSGTVKVDSKPVDKDKLAPEYQAMLEWNPEAFIAFYNRFAKYPMPDHCRQWVYDAFDHKLLLLNVPPRHNKSTLFAIWWPVWNIVRNRNYQMLIVSATSSLATQWTAYIAANLAYGDIPVIFGRFKPDTMSGEIPWRPSRGQLMVTGRTTPGGTGMQFSVLGLGQGQQVLGFEADGVVGDDMTTRQVAVSETQREAQIEWWEGDVMSRPERPEEGRVIVVGQRVHASDIYGYLQEKVRTFGVNKGKPVYHHIVYPAVLQEPDEAEGIPAKVLWPEKWSYERLMGEVYDEVGGEAAWQTRYQQDPMSASQVLVREEWLERCRDYDRAVGFGAPATKEGEEFLPVARVASLDPSPGKYNGLVIADIVSGRDAFWAFLVDIKSFKSDWHSIRQEVDNIIEKYHPTYFIFEQSVASHWREGDPYIEELRNKVRILEHTTSGASKWDAEMGIESLSFEFEMGRIRMPYKDALSRSTSGLLERELRNWTREGRLRDDVLMALWFIKYNWRKLTPLNKMPRTFRGAKQVEVSYRSRLRSNDDVVAAFRKRRDAQRRLKSA